MLTVMFRLLRIVAAVLALSAASAAVHAQENRPVKILSNVVDMRNATRALFSPDGTLLATVFESGIALWDPASGGIVRTLDHAAYLTSAAFSRDGRWMIAAFKDGSIKLWDLTVDAAPVTLQDKRKSGDDSDEPVTAFWMQDDKTLLAGTDQGKIVVWDIAGREKRRTMKFDSAPEGTRGDVLAIRVTADQRVIAVREVSAKVFDLTNGKSIVEFNLPNQYPLWNAKEKNTFVEGSIVSDDGLFVFYSAPDCEIAEVKFLSLADRENLVSIDKADGCKRPEGKNSFLSPSVFSSSIRPNVLIARSGAADIKEWDPKTRSVVRNITRGEEMDSELIGVDPGFTKMAALKEDSLRIRSLEDGRAIREITSSEDAAELIAVAKDGGTMMLVQDTSNKGKEQKQVTFWQVGALNPKPVALATSADASVSDFSPAAKLAMAVNSNNEVALYATETGSELRKFPVPGVKELARARLSPDGKLVALVGEAEQEERVAVLVDASDGTVKRKFGGSDQRNGVVASTGRDDESDFVTAVAFSADGARLALGRFNGTAEIWDVKTLRRLKTLPASRKNSDQIWSLAFTPDGRKLIAGSRDSGVFLWDVATGRLPRTFLYDGLAGHVHVACAAVSHDGATVAGGLAQHAVSSGDTGPEHGIQVWDSTNGKLRFTLRGHDGGIGGLAFSRDDRWIISASFDGTIKYWNRKTGRLAATLRMMKVGRWFALTDSGFFAAQAGGEDSLNAASAFKSVPASKFGGKLNRPDLVEALLSGDSQDRIPAALRELDLNRIWRDLSP